MRMPDNGQETGTSAINAWGILDRKGIQRTELMFIWQSASDVHKPILQ